MNRSSIFFLIVAKINYANYNNKYKRT